ncbi:MAG: hypothetical protein ACREJT_01735 [Myxococcota bacterium]
MMRAVVALVCLALALACGREERQSAPLAAPAPLAPVDGEGHIDPASYRAQIEAMETLLYAETLDDAGWRALSKALLDLHNEIVFRDSSASARDTSGRLFFLSARADAASATHHGERELESLRVLWEHLSSEKFAPADWIRAGASSR